MFTVLTPVRNARTYLPACVASVADQTGVHREHIVLDGASTDGTVEWLRTFAPCGEQTQDNHIFRWLSAADCGMYDALNRGLDLARGEWISWLNSDEQYLEDALVHVARAAALRPHVDLWYGDVLIVDPSGMCLAWRRAASPRWASIAATHLYVQTCGMFFHRRVIEAGVRFSNQWRIVGDEAFVIELLRRGARAGRIREVLAAFALTGQNLGLGPAALEEARRLKALWPKWVRGLRGVLQLAVWVRRAAAGGCIPPGRVAYRLYAGNPPVRRSFEAVHPSWQWPGDRPCLGMEPQ